MEAAAECRSALRKAASSRCRPATPRRPLSKVIVGANTVTPRRCVGEAPRRSGRTWSAGAASRPPEVLRAARRYSTSPARHARRAGSVERRQRDWQTTLPTQKPPRPWRAEAISIPRSPGPGDTTVTASVKRSHSAAGEDRSVRARPSAGAARRSGRERPARPRRSSAAGARAEPRGNGTATRPSSATTRRSPGAATGIRTSRGAGRRSDAGEHASTQARRATPGRRLERAVTVEEEPARRRPGEHHRRSGQAGVQVERLRCGDHGHPRTPVVERERRAPGRAQRAQDPAAECGGERGRPEEEVEA